MKTLADAGNANAQCALADIYFDSPQEGIRNVELAFLYYSLAAKQGHSKALCGLGHCYFHGRGVQKDLKAALINWTLSADQNCGSARYNLGMAYLQGWTGPVDQLQAAREFRRAIRHGDEDAKLQFDLLPAEAKETALEEEKGIDASELTEAGAQIARLRPLADEGKINSICDLADVYFDTKNVGVKNPLLAHHYYNLAAEKLHRRGQCGLGTCFFQGFGVPVDQEKAVYYWALSAKQNSPLARYNLGLANAHGWGGPVNHVQAAREFRLAMQLGDEDAEGQLELLPLEAQETALFEEKERNGIAVKRMARKVCDLKNRARVVDPYGPQLEEEEEKLRVEIKPSGIPNGGRGVWALQDFKSGDVISEYLGKRTTREEAYNQMEYSIEFTNDEGEVILLDGYGFFNSASVANDAQVCYIFICLRL